jgi:DMSO/TMAO reductase YedYZ molybdopterin-dependent catalytic subunit
MKKKLIVTRREVLVSGLAAMGGLLLPGCKSKEMPPTYGNILRMGDNLTYYAHRALLPGQSLVREYDPRDISSFPATGTFNPADSSAKYYSEEWDRLHKNDFADWRLPVEGLVTKPLQLSLKDLMAFPAQKQITRHSCEEGWTAIAEWTGVRLGDVLKSAGIKPNARFVNYYAYDGFTDSLDMLDAFHPQTILAYGMNGKKLPVPHGAPIRMRVETQIGYKSVKYLNRIVVTDEFDDFGENGAIPNGWAWYNGI